MKFEFGSCLYIHVAFFWGGGLSDKGHHNQHHKRAINCQTSILLYESFSLWEQPNTIQGLYITCIL